MYSGYETIEDYERDIYGLNSDSGDESGSDIEQVLYQQVHYAQTEQNGQVQDQGHDDIKIEYNTSESKPTANNLNDRDSILEPIKTEEKDGASQSKSCSLSDRGDSVVASKSLPKKRKFEMISLVTSDSDSVTFVGQYPAKKVKEEKPKENKNKKNKEKNNSISKKTGNVNVGKKHKYESDNSVIWLSDSESEPEWTVIDNMEDEANNANILTNLVGVRSQQENKDREEELQEKWNISAEDLMNDIQNSQGRNRSTRARRYYASKSSIRCFNCGNNGHLSNNCPSPKKTGICFLCAQFGHRSFQCPKQICGRCSQTGHQRKHCWMSSDRDHVECVRCNQYGHISKECPDRWRQFHATTTANVIRKIKLTNNKRMFCYNCANKGHFGHECSKGRMDNTLYPSLPFVYQYDTWKYVQKTFHYLKLEDNRAKERGRANRPNSHIVFDDNDDRDYVKKSRKGWTSFSGNNVDKKNKKKDKASKKIKDKKEKKKKKNYQLEKNVIKLEEEPKFQKMRIQIKNNHYNGKKHNNYESEECFPRSTYSKTNKSPGAKKDKKKKKDLKKFQKQLGEHKNDQRKQNAKRKKANSFKKTKVVVSSRGFRRVTHQ